MKLPVFPVEGGCVCGAVRYKLTGGPRGVYNCHCKDCQRTSGGTGTISMVVPRENVVLLKGEMVAYDKAADSGASCACWAARTAAPRCGTSRSRTRR
ncbi:MAG: GFA family protein [Bauldia sp.]